MTQQTTRHPLPAPLPRSSRAGRGDIPAAPTTPTPDADHYDPDAPLLREDEFTLVVCGSMVGFFILIMTAVAAMGGL